MSAVVVVDKRSCSGLDTVFAKTKRALDAGARVRLYPPPRGGFDLVKNGAAFLATDLSGMPIGTYHSVGVAIDAWRGHPDACGAKL